MNQRAIPLLFLMALAFLLFPLAGCAQKSPSIPPEDLPKVKSIAVLPVEIIGEGSSQARPAAESAELLKGQQVMNALLAEYFSNTGKAVLISEAQRDLFGKDFSLCRSTAAVTICRTHKTDAVLLVTLHRFAERHGTEYSVEKPASVTFDYKLIAADTGQTLCAGVFHETQQAALENLFTIFKHSKRGFKWVKAEDLARDGLKQKLDECPVLTP